LEQTADGWRVVTDKGVITCEHVVNAAGLWAKQVGRMAGIELPVSPLKHHYLISDTIPEIAELDFEVPMTVDLEGFTYMRQEIKRVCCLAFMRSSTSIGRWMAPLGITGWSCFRNRRTG